MKTIASVLVGLSVLAGAAASASAATKCSVKGWIDSGQGGRPIWECSETN
jgi:hypothetical protein